jgi:DNA-binding transcriptional regulator YiaG
MTAPELRAFRDRHAITAPAAAKLLGIGERTWFHWLAGDNPVPEAAAKLLRWAYEGNRPIIP